MKTLFALLLVAAAGLPLSAQTVAALPTDFAAAGGGYNASLPSQRVTGWAAYGHEFAANFYSFTRMDVLGVSQHPLQAQTVVTTGVCQITKQISRFFFGGCLDGGVASSDTNVGGAIGADAVAGVRLGKSQHWAVIVMGGILKTALSDSQNPVRVGVVYGWGH